MQEIAVWLRLEKAKIWPKLKFQLAPAVWLWIQMKSGHEMQHKYFHRLEWLPRKMQRTSRRSMRVLWDQPRPCPRRKSWLMRAVWLSRVAPVFLLWTTSSAMTSAKISRRCLNRALWFTTRPLTSRLGVGSLWGIRGEIRCQSCQGSDSGR